MDLAHLAALALCLSVKCAESKGTPIPFDNMAFGSPTFQSSVAEGGEGSRAVDGGVNATWEKGSCTLSLQEIDPWWVVDLGFRRQADRVDITASLSGVELTNLRLGSTDTDPLLTPPTFASMDVCVSRDVPLTPGGTETFGCGSTGRYVVVLLEGNHTLSLCEVKVYEENIAAYQATTQSSIIWQGIPQKANDGSRTIYDGGLYFSKTNLYIEEHPWWSVDLLWSRLVDRVHIQTVPCWYEACILRHIHIGVTDISPELQAPNLTTIDICHYEVKMAINTRSIFQCGKAGRYLVVYMAATGRSLRICEVEAFTSEPASEAFLAPDEIPLPDPGPFTYRPTQSFSPCFLSSLSPSEHEAVRECFRACFLNPCCQAVNITSCQQSYVKTDALDFVKEGLGTTPTEDCSCRTRNFNTPENNLVSTFQDYRASNGYARNITIFFSRSIVGIQVDYEGGYSGMLGYRAFDSVQCVLGPDERFTGVEVYIQHNGVRNPGPMAITLLTNRQVFGPFGDTSVGLLYRASGHGLLYVSAWLLYHLEDITFHFDYDCAAT